MANRTTKPAQDTAHDVEDTLRKGQADAAGLAKGNLEALIAANQALLSGGNALGSEVVAFAQERLHKSLAHGRSLAECSSPQQALELQAAYLRDALQAYAGETTKLSEMMARLASEAWAPLQSRAGSVAEQAGDSAAA